MSVIRGKYETVKKRKVASLVGRERKNHFYIIPIEEIRVVERTKNERKKIPR